MLCLRYTVVVALSMFCIVALADEPLDTSRADQQVAEYFVARTAELRDACLADITTLEDWESRRGEYRRQLFEMLGLDPLPERTDLAPVVTGRLEHEEFTVENIQFQSRPQLYVTGNLYLPKNRTERAPAILYVCGHGGVTIKGIDYGNKTHYQHHGEWFARHGYVCLTIDTLQLGEIRGLHHGTHNLGMWWWLARGYTPAGVEAWNCIRALDYLQSREEVDPERLGVTGRSGGGAYSWWIAALDDRIKVAVPVAGITDLTNYVVDGCVTGHCDCMFMLNTYRWDYPQVAALVAPRPLLIANTDRDGIFPLEGVIRTHAKVRKIYELYGAADKLGLNITAGPHLDTQELQMHAFRWFDQHLMKQPRTIDKAAVKFFEPQQLKVLAELPADELNTKIQETFVPSAAAPPAPESAEAWSKLRDDWLAKLRDKSFRGWPPEGVDVAVQPVFSTARDGIQLAAYDFMSDPQTPLRLYVAHREKLEKADLVVLNVLDEPGWNEFLATYSGAFAEELNDERLPEANAEALRQTQGMFKSFAWAMAYVAPRGVGRSRWNPEEKHANQIRRRFYLLGQTLEGMQVWDTRRAIGALRSLDSFAKTPLWLQSERQMAGVALYASLFEPNIVRLDLHDLPTSHRTGPALLNVQRWFDLPQTVAMAAERSQVILYQDGENTANDWAFPVEVAKRLQWGEKRFQIRKPN